MAEQVSKLLEEAGLPVRPRGVMLPLTENDRRLLAEKPRRVELVCMNCHAPVTRTSVEISDGSPLSIEILEPRVLTCHCGNGYLERMAYRVIR